MALLLPPRPQTDRQNLSTAVDGHAVACRRLAAADPIMRRIIADVGRCTLKPRTDYFATLCDSIIAQQLSVTVAGIIFDRFAALYPRRRPTPQAVLGTPLRRLRAIGLSRQKADYLKDLAAGCLDGRIKLNRLARQSSEEIIASLVSIHGIGRWTAEMFLIFSLNRPDVLPVDDFGIRKAIRRWYGLRSLPKSARTRAIGKAWHPYESVACWYLWRSLRL